MPQGRIILKSICQSKKLSELKTDGARLLYTWLIPCLDIKGRFSGDEDVIKGQIFTRLKKTIPEISKYLTDLAHVGLIIWYETDNDKYLEVPDFAHRQPSLNPTKEAESSIPAPTPDQLQSSSCSTPPKVKESKIKVKESKTEFPPEIDKPDFHKVWKEWIQFRSEIKKKLAPSTIKGQLKKLSKLPVETAIAMLEQSIQNGWQGIFPLKESQTGSKTFAEKEFEAKENNKQADIRKAIQYATDRNN